MAITTMPTQCHYWVWQQDNILKKYKDLPLFSKTKGFIIEFRYQEKLRRDYPPHDDCRLLYFSTEPVYMKQYAANSKVAMQLILCPRLSLMEVPQEDHDKQVQETLFLAGKHASQRGLVPLVVEIVSYNVTKGKSEEDKVVDLVREKSIKIQMFQPLPILDNHKSFIKRLKMGLVYDELEVCGICLKILEEKLVGANVTWLPCSHAYHAGCIGKWNKIKPSCPTCRLHFFVC